MTGIGYSYIRALEFEGTHPHDVGQWGITGMRLLYSEGLPDGFEDVLVPVNADRIPQPTLISHHTVFHASRTRFYRRIRTADEAARLMTSQQNNRSSKACLPLFASWHTTDDGIIPLPEVGEPVAPDTHAIELVRPIRLSGVSVDGVADAHHFHFVNSWGAKWGARGHGALPFAYYDRYVFEHWQYYKDQDIHSFYRKRRQSEFSSWQGRDEFDRRIYGFEVGDRDKNRLGWALAIETNGAIEVEDICVAHKYRRQGIGYRLADGLRQLADAKKLPLRIWISFADTKRESPGTFAALPRLAQRLGVEFRVSPVRWAAYFATNEKKGSHVPIEPKSMPTRPKSTRDVLAAFAISLSSLETSTTKPEPLTANGIVANADSESWPEQNRRRCELIDKKYADGLTTAEDDELDRLQMLAREVISAHVPPLMFTPEERAFLESKAWPR